MQKVVPPSPTFAPAHIAYASVQSWLLVVALLLAVASISLAEDRPYLLVRKSLVNGEFIANKNTFVQVEIFNVGASTAFDVNLDDEWDEKFRVTGLSDAHWDRIAPCVLRYSPTSFAALT